MGTNSDKARAELLFKKEQRFRDGQIAAAAYEAEQQAIRQKTARLRAFVGLGFMASRRAKTSAAVWSIAARVTSEVVQ